MAPKKDTAASKKANESAPAEAPAAPATTTTKKSASTHPSYKGTCFFTWWFQFYAFLTNSIFFLVCFLDMIKEAILQVG